MAKDNIYSGFKGFILKILVFFLPRPASAPEGTPVVTLKGIYKIIFRLGIAFALGCLLVIICNILEQTGKLGEIMKIKSSSTLSRGCTFAEAILLVIFGLYYVLMPILRYMYRWLRVTGMIYAFSGGFLLSFLLERVKENWMLVALISVTSSVILGSLPILLFRYKHFQLPKQAAKITYISFVVMTLGGAVLKLLNQIPYIGIVSGQISSLSSYTEAKLLIAAVNIVIAFLFLFLAYDRIRDYIKRGVSKQYEWLITFTIFYTISIIVGKIHVILALIIH